VTTQKTTQKILDLIAANPFMSRKELAEKIGLTTDGIKYHLASLQKKGRLKRIGPDKGGRWAVSGD
jgi:ATP-dependent DNA helicase RecG